MSLTPASAEPRELSPCDLYNLLQDSSVTKNVFDVREKPSDFADTAVRASLHVELGASPSIELKSFSAAAVRRYVVMQDEIESVSPAPKSNAWTQRGLFPANLVVLVGDGDGGDDGGSEENRAAKVASLLVSEGKVRGDRVCVAVGGIPAFQRSYPMCCSSFARKKMAIPGFLPSEIVDGFLFLGSYDNAKARDTLKSLGITHILCMAAELENPHPDGEFEYLKLGIDDKRTEDVAQHFETALQFIRDAREANEGSARILVHCALGISRSSAICMAYLMKTESWEFARAHAFVKSRRSCVKPNEGFVEQLKRYDDEK
jgi:predicted protein tyrosine phosphatase